MAEESHTYKLIGQHLSFSTTNKQSSFLYVVVYEQIHALQTNPYVTNGAIKKKKLNPTALRSEPTRGFSFLLCQWLFGLLGESLDAMVDHALNAAGTYAPGPDI